jgi:alkanesulfonate monooxygenase SsuD/methylene tetrahydromethanopterin reductase-like flavin-dependent oxidoreductase (luciferase family)
VVRASRSGETARERDTVAAVKVQVGVSPFGSSRESVLDLARRAADAGLDGLILGDGFVSTPSFPIWSGGIDCFVELAWLAGHVDVPTYGIDAVVAPARDPRILAKQASSLSAVTAGRCHLALAAGFWEEDARLFGFDFAERGARLDEGLRALIAAWRGEPFEGKYWSWEAPLPISPCHAVAPPELWLSGAEATMRRALRYGLPFQPTRLSPDDVTLLARKYAAAGGTSFKVRTRMSVTQPVRAPGALDFSTLVGPASYLAHQIDAYAALGADYISIVAGFDDRSCAETIEALGLAVRSLSSV